MTKFITSSTVVGPDLATLAVFLAFIAFIGIAYLFGRKYMIRPVALTQIHHTYLLTKRLKRVRRFTRQRYSTSYRFHNGKVRYPLIDRVRLKVNRAKDPEMAQLIETKDGGKIACFRLISISVQRLLAASLAAIIALMSLTQLHLVRQLMISATNASGGTLGADIMTATFLGLIVFATYHAIMATANQAALDAVVDYGDRAIAQGALPRFYERKSLLAFIRGA